MVAAVTIECCFTNTLVILNHILISLATIIIAVIIAAYPFFVVINTSTLVMFAYCYPYYFSYKYTIVLRRTDSVKTMHFSYLRSSVNIVPYIIGTLTR